MITTHIYRVEDVFGNGIYFSNVIRWIFNEDPECNAIRESHKDLMCPQEEDALDNYILDSEYCAFKSTQDLCQWMTKEGLKYLVDLGFLVKELEVNTSECRVGDHQVVFKKKGIIRERILNLI